MSGGEMAVLTAVALTAEGIGLVKKTSEKEAASKARLDTLKLQSKQSTIKHQQEVLSNYDILEKTISTQIAQASAKGVALDSLSFEAIQRDTVNKAAKEEKNLEIEESLFQKGINIEKKNVKRTLHASLFGDIAGSAFEFAKIIK
jgi:hypothetical protein